MIHTKDPVCPGCEAKLKQVHPALQAFFDRVKFKYPQAHVAWGYRGAADQEQLFLEKKSDLHYPNSKHNATKPDGTPEARAIDLFLEDEDGVARWPLPWYQKVARELALPPIRWGIHLKSGALDAPHFELA